MEKKPVTNYEIHVMMQRGMTVEAVIDCVIHANRIIGVGLITLGDALKDYCYKHGGPGGTSWSRRPSATAGRCA
jgi:hypothetical protein